MSKKELTPLFLHGAEYMASRVKSARLTAVASEMFELLQDIGIYWDNRSDEYGAALPSELENLITRFEAITKKVRVG